MAGRRKERLRQQEMNRQKTVEFLNLPRIKDFEEAYPHLKANPEGPIYSAWYSDLADDLSYRSIILSTDKEIDIPKSFRGIEIKVEYVDREKTNRFETECKHIRKKLWDAGAIPGSPGWKAYMDSPAGKAEIEEQKDYWNRVEEAESAADDLDELLGDSVENIKLFESDDVFSFLVTLKPDSNIEVPITFRGYPASVCDPTPHWQIWYQDENGNADLVKEGLCEAEAIIFMHDFRNEDSPGTFSLRKSNMPRVECGK